MSQQRQRERSEWQDNPTAQHFYFGQGPKLDFKIPKPCGFSLTKCANVHHSLTHSIADDACKKCETSLLYFVRDFNCKRECSIAGRVHCLHDRNDALDFRRREIRMPNICT